MDVNSVIATATAMKAAETQNEVSTAVTKKVLDTARTNGNMVLQLMQAATGMGQNIDITA